MNDEFAVDETGMTSDGYHRLQEVSKKSMYLSNFIKFAIVGAAVLGIVHIRDFLFEDNADLACTVLFIAFVAFAAYLIIGPQIFYKRYRYRLVDDKVEIRRGILVITHTMVPIERIHQVQVSKGPINRMFGLANVVITTAGGVTSLEYLDESTAESIASKLNECVVKLLKDRD